MRLERRSALIISLARLAESRNISSPVFARVDVYEVPRLPSQRTSRRTGNGCLSDDAAE